TGTIVGNWRVLYASTGNQVLVRLPTAGPADANTTQTIEQIATATQIRSIVLDPRNYTIAYATTDAGVFERDPGNCVAGVCQWTLISGELFNANFLGEAFVPGTNGAADVLLVGS